MSIGAHLDDVWWLVGGLVDDEGLLELGAAPVELVPVGRWRAL